MLTVKMLGVLFMLFVGGIAAYSLVSYEKRTVTVLDGWIDLIRHIRTEIDCYLTPLNEILAKCPAGERDLGILLKRTSVYLDANARHLIEGFQRDLGGSYREQQLKLCDRCIEELRCRRASRAAELPTRLKLSVTLALCITIGSAILLW